MTASRARCCNVCMRTLRSMQQRSTNTTFYTWTPSTPEPHLSLCEMMRQSTRAIHKRSDAIVNAKLSVALLDRQLYGQAIALFYVIFRELETILMTQVEPTSPLGQVVQEFITPCMARTRAFEADLQTYLGEDWAKQVRLTPPAVAYIDHLRALAREGPPYYLLIPYVYHLYMAILSGGQVLRNITKRAMGIKGGKGAEGLLLYSLDFPQGETLTSFKERFREAINQLVDLHTIPEDALEAVLSEGIHMFRMNNNLVRSFGIRRWAFRMAAYLLLVLMALAWLVSTAMKYRGSRII